MAENNSIKNVVNNNTGNLNIADYLEFSELQEGLKIKNKELFMIYIKEVFKDLAERDDGNKKKGVPKVTFLEYLKIPVFIAESMFQFFDQNKDGYLSLSEFGEGLTLLFLGEFHEIANLIFNIYDNNQDGFIHKEDIRLLLSYLPLKEDNTITAYKHQLESQTEINEIVEATFTNKSQLNFKEYLKITENKKSDSFLQLLCYLYEKKPFNETNIELIINKKDEIGNKKSSSPSPNKDSYNKINENSPSNNKLEKSLNNKNEFHSPQIKKRIVSPKKGSYLSPAHNYIKKTSLNNKSPSSKRETIEVLNLKNLNINPISNFTNNSSNDIEIENYDYINNTNSKDLKASAYEGMRRMHNLKEVTKDSINNIEDEKNINVSDSTSNIDKVIDISTSKFDSPSNFLRRLVPKKKEFSIISNLVKISNDESVDKHHNYEILKKTKEVNLIDLPAMEGWIYKITESNKLKKYWLVINNKDIYYYRSDKKDELSGMHNLSGCHTKESPPTVIGNTKLFSFVIYFQNKARTYYCTDREQSIGWINRLRKALGYESFFDYYEIVDDIGQGKFGVVKLGVHKNTKLRVAIKTIKKENLKTKQDRELVKTEIDIMKLCRHPNIVSLLDHFENSEYIFIVMEYIQGGDLTKYVRKYYGGKNNKTLPEKRVAEIMKQLASGLEYLHYYGIIHRDLKPDNLMMTERSVSAEIKIMDFGLSKIMHHDEKVADGFGTLSFVAPEVLIRKPYNTKVDVWSLGVTIFNLLSGDLPFDDPSDNEEVIARKVVYSDIEYKSKVWEKISKEAKSLIKECLLKDPEKRITISKFLNHPWISITS